VESDRRLSGRRTSPLLQEEKHHSLYALVSTVLSEQKGTICSFCGIRQQTAPFNPPRSREEKERGDGIAGKTPNKHQQVYFLILLASQRPQTLGAIPKCKQHNTRAYTQLHKSILFLFLVQKIN